MGLHTNIPHYLWWTIKNNEWEQFHILIRLDAKPFCSTLHSIPFTYRDILKNEIDLRTICTEHHQEMTKATEWWAPIVVAPKRTHRIHICVHLSHLNKLHECYQSPAPPQVVADIAAGEAKVFTVLDALKVYHQCSLDQQSQPLTTFTTQLGRFKYLMSPYGISSISEHYNRLMTEAFTGFRCIVDDIMIYDNNAADHIIHVKQFLHAALRRQEYCSEHRQMQVLPD